MTIKDYYLKSSVSNNWQEDPFYTSSLVLGLDIGIEGIGVWLRKGPTPLFYRTYLVTLPDSAPLSGRRQMRAARRARKSRQHRENQLKAWIVKYGLLTKERVEEIWRNPKVFQNAFDLRHRAMNAGLKSTEALIVCIRHLVKHRGFDYHMTEEGSHPWGESLEYSDITKWLNTAVVSGDYATKTIQVLRDNAEWALNDKAEETEKLKKIELSFDDAVKKYDNNPVEVMLTNHLKEKNHVNLRERARGHNFPRELIKGHLRQICEKHKSFFGSNFDGAMNELLGALQSGAEVYHRESIIDYHRKTPEEVKALWERKVNDCPFSQILHDLNKINSHPQKCSSSNDEDIRKWKLSGFLAERTVVAKSGERFYLPERCVKNLFELLDKDIKAIKNKTPRPELTSLRKQIEEFFGKEFKLAPDSASHNKDFFFQLKDLLKAKFLTLNKRAGLSSSSAKALFDIATNCGVCLEPEKMLKNLIDAEYYKWRLNGSNGGPRYPQVEFLMGPRIQNDKQTVHGILRRIFARPEIQQYLEGKQCPDFSVVECIGDIPRNTKQKKELLDDLKSSRKNKDAIYEKYGLSWKSNSQDIKKALLFDQQQGHCPYTVESLGKSPLSNDLEIDHIFPRSKGGISEMVNLVLTKRITNGEKGDRTPVQWKGKKALSDILPKMKWNKAKKELFLREETECPEWENITRTAQLARQLKKEIASWMEIEDQPGQIAKRIGTPTGFMTSICRHSWKDKLPEWFYDPETGKKDRNNLRHHMLDAAIVSHIPPGKGLNNIVYGGIFLYDSFEKAGQINMSAIPDLGPDLVSFQSEHTLDCLVTKPRQSKSKKSRTDKTIYGVDGKQKNGNPILWSREEIQAKQNKQNDNSPLIPVKNVESMLQNSGIPVDKLPRKTLQNWMTSDKSKTLKLIDGTPVLRVPVEGNNEALSSLVPHYNHESSKPIGYKVSTETYLRKEIWQGETIDKKSKVKIVYDSLLIPHPRNLRNLRKQKLKNKISFSKSHLRNLKKVGHFEKGQLVFVPLDREGNIDSIHDSKKHFCSLWYRVTGIMTNGQLLLQLAEFDSTKSTPLKNLERQIELLQPSSAEVLAFIIEYNQKIKA